MPSFSRSVLVADGDLGSLRVCEDGNRTGKALMLPRVLPSIPAHFIYSAIAASHRKP